MRLAMMVQIPFVLLFGDSRQNISSSRKVLRCCITKTIRSNSKKSSIGCWGRRSKLLGKSEKMRCSTGWNLTHNLCFFLRQSWQINYDVVYAYCVWIACWVDFVEFCFDELFCGISCFSFFVGVAAGCGSSSIHCQ